MQNDDLVAPKIMEGYVLPEVWVMGGLTVVNWDKRNGVNHWMLYTRSLRW